MKIISVTVNRRRRAFLVRLGRTVHPFPFARCEPPPSVTDPVDRVAVDPELAREAFTFVLRSGAEGSVHAEQVLDYNQDPSYLRDLLVYRLTLEARARLAESGLSRREIIRRLGIPTTLDALREEDIPALAQAACEEALLGYPVPRYMDQATCEAVIRKVLPEPKAEAAGAAAPKRKAAPRKTAPRKAAAKAVTRTAPKAAAKPRPRARKAPTAA